MITIDLITTKRNEIKSTVTKGKLQNCRVLHHIVEPISTTQCNLGKSPSKRKGNPWKLIISNLVGIHPSTLGQTNCSCWKRKLAQFFFKGVSVSQLKKTHSVLNLLNPLCLPATRWELRQEWEILPFIPISIWKEKTNFILPKAISVWKVWKFLRRVTSCNDIFNQVFFYQMLWNIVPSSSVCQTKSS